MKLDIDFSFGIKKLLKMTSPILNELLHSNDTKCRLRKKPNFKIL